MKSKPHAYTNQVKCYRAIQPAPRDLENDHQGQTGSSTPTINRRNLSSPSKQFRNVASRKRKGSAPSCGSTKRAKQTCDDEEESSSIEVRRNLSPPSVQESPAAEKQATAEGTIISRCEQGLVLDANKNIEDAESERMAGPSPSAGTAPGGQTPSLIVVSRHNRQGDSQDSSESQPKPTTQAPQSMIQPQTSTGDCVPLTTKLNDLSETPETGSQDIATLQDARVHAQKRNACVADSDRSGPDNAEEENAPHKPARDLTDIWMQHALRMQERYLGSQVPRFRHGKRSSPSTKRALTSTSSAKCSVSRHPRQLLILQILTAPSAKV